VEEGRRIYNNMQAFFCFVTSWSIEEICALFLATLPGSGISGTFDGYASVVG
jgi:P-type Ca2+ transporter type 2C